MGAILLTITDSGSGADTVTPAATISASDTGAGADTSSPTASISLTETGAGSDAWSLTVAFTITDPASGADSIAVSAAISLTDAGAGADVQGIVYTITVADAGIGTDIPLPNLAVLTITDYGLGAEFAWRLQGSIMVGSFTLPHILSIKITDAAAISDKKIQGGSLPQRKMRGKPGRIVEITGWTKTQSDIDAMQALVDGVSRVFLHPSGDSFAVLVMHFDPSRHVDEYSRRRYKITLTELRTW